MSADESFLILGGGGMIGLQAARHIARELRPRLIVIASLHKAEVQKAVRRLRGEFPELLFEGFWGDVFLRPEWNGKRPLSRAELMKSASHRAALFEDLMGDIEQAYARSQLVDLILRHRPDVIIDSINTATAISYQDIYTASILARQRFEEHSSILEQEEDLSRIRESAQRVGQAMESLVISLSVPQLVRHVLLIHRAMREAGTRLYLKIGTTGTGGMGLNIPYTHSEDKPSAVLMSKSAVAFAHTGLLFLMARTPNGPIVKEIKPGAMVGYADITYREVQERGRVVFRFSDRVEKLGTQLTLRYPESDFQRLEKLKIPVVDTGENGTFTRGEFEAITHLRQMEFITPEELAQQIVLEIKGSNTGYDVIAAIDSAVVNPTYRAGFLRHFALEEIARLERETGTPSVALGQLGPPELGKLLWEAQLLKLRYGSLSSVLRHSSRRMAQELYKLLEEEPYLRQTITSIGLPILTPGGRDLIRGPLIRIPEVPGKDRISLNPSDIDRWAAKGWVDLRPRNMQRWKERFRHMRREARSLKGRGSAAITRSTYLTDEIRIGEAVGWIFNNEEEGYRIK